MSLLVSAARRIGSNRASRAAHCVAGAGLTAAESRDAAILWTGGASSLGPGLCRLRGAVSGADAERLSSAVSAAGDSETCVRARARARARLPLLRCETVPEPRPPSLWVGGRRRGRRQARG